LLALFGLIEARSAGHLVPLRIFRSRALVGGNLVLLTAGMAIDGTLLISRCMRRMCSATLRSSSV
jgi:hypothetical protein